MTWKYLFKENYKFYSKYYGDTATIIGLLCTHFQSNGKINYVHYAIFLSKLPNNEILIYYYYFIRIK